MTSAVTISSLSKTFRSPGRRERKALDTVSLDIAAGEMVALIGASGSGKSTLLRHIAGLTLGDGGRVLVDGGVIQADGRMGPGIRMRRRSIGVIFQQFNLVGRLPVLTNVLIGSLGRLPSWRTLLGLFPRVEKERAMEALARVGIADLATQRASTLSGGQQQRAAIARALVQRASLVLADEPIASLDPESARRVMETLATINREDALTVVVTLHQVDYARVFCPRTVALRDGRVVYDGPSTALTPSFLSDLYGSESDLVFGAAPPQAPRHAEPALGVAVGAVA